MQLEDGSETEEDLLICNLTVRLGGVPILRQTDVAPDVANRERNGNVIDQRRWIAKGAELVMPSQSERQPRSRHATGASLADHS